MKAHVLIALAMSMVASTSALAHGQRSHAPRNQSPYASANAFAYAPAGVRSSNPSFDVFDTRGRYLGSDPDPQVRSALARDPGIND